MTDISRSTYPTQLSRAREIALAGAAATMDPGLLFGGVAPDDLTGYPAESLVLAAALATSELNLLERDDIRVSVLSQSDIVAAGRDVSVISIVGRDAPFLFDSVMGELSAARQETIFAAHPIVAKERSGSSSGQERISVIQIHLPWISNVQARSLQARLSDVLTQVHRAVDDWQAMRNCLQHTISDLEAHSARVSSPDTLEAVAFLRWLDQNNFTFLGMRMQSFEGSDVYGPQSRTDFDLGILKDTSLEPIRKGNEDESRAFLKRSEILFVTKADLKSVVHRRSYMDYVAIKRFDTGGGMTGELRVVGLFASSAYTRAISEVPLLRRKASAVVDSLEYEPLSYSGKMLANTLESYPRDDLFQIETPTLEEFCKQIVQLAERPRVRVLARVDHFNRFASVLVYLPKEQYDSTVRQEIGQYLASIFRGRLSAYYLAFPRESLVRIHFIFGRDGDATPVLAQSDLERSVSEIATSWSDRFAALAHVENVTLSGGSGFRAAFSPAEAYVDLPNILLCHEGHSPAVLFYRRVGDPPTSVALKIYNAGKSLPLSRRVPLLENLGFKVLSEESYDLVLRSRTGSATEVILHDMELAHDMEVDLAGMGELLKAAYLGVWNGGFEDDDFNRLILAARLDVRQASLLRSYARYLRQAGIVYSQKSVAEALWNHPSIATHIVLLFQQQFQPGLEERERQVEIERLNGLIEQDLSSVPSVQEDTILRHFYQAVSATLRTNYFQSGLKGEPHAGLALKLDSSALEWVPEPRPFREIFVYGPEVEGVHLRFGKVARGGLRWSDRAQDYRTEVLGLVKAQQIKNAIIVPVGAKGGFYPTALPSNGTRKEIVAAGTSAYRTFIASLLSVTDNIVGQEVVPPPNTVRRDGDDPYFVVAADKGTATFSDVANAIAHDAGFWLEDAFASGGSAGYDHKKMGITARGAWEAVKRHFREINVDIQSQPFSVVGVGDMSGDVFGNGMLLSEQTRLIAAFDHRDIFIDPDPDLMKSFSERKRLFEMAASTWQEYDRRVLSSGGMIVSRRSKMIALTKEAAAALGVQRTVMTPDEVVSTILKAQVDMLWFGGIGTYIRGPSESDAEVGDRANNSVRVSAEELQAKVVGEGANLGMTQRARIAYGLDGGRCNSDAIDNSAGVNSSDYEVNIKIALASAIKDGRLDIEGRNKVLESMTDQVARLVLRNNYAQTLAISVTENARVVVRGPLRRLMRHLEFEGRLKRHLEFLPSDAALAERYQTGGRLVRAEIAVLLSYAKLALFDWIVGRDLIDDPYLRGALFGYFPDVMRTAFVEDIENHRLRREIVATVVANDIINRGGPAIVVETMLATGAAVDDVVESALVARDAFDLVQVQESIDLLDNEIDGEMQLRLHAEVRNAYANLLVQCVRARLGHSGLGERIAAVKQARLDLNDVIQNEISEALGERRDKFVQGGVPASLADAIVKLRASAPVPEVMSVAMQTGFPVSQAASKYFEVTRRLGVDRLLELAEQITAADEFEERVISRNIAVISAARYSLTVSSLAGSSKAPEEWTTIAGNLAQFQAGDMTLAKMTLAAGVLNDAVSAS